jgi:hypothetical protein
VVGPDQCVGFHFAFKNRPDEPLIHPVSGTVKLIKNIFRKMFGGFLELPGIAPNKAYVEKILKKGLPYQQPISCILHTTVTTSKTSLPHGD